MKKFRFLLLDANIVIQLLELNLWEVFIANCDIHVSSIVVSEEVRFYYGHDDETHYVDISKYVNAGQITQFDVSATELQLFSSQFSDDYLAKLDPGEAESLCYLLKSSEPCQVCSSDAIVFRVLACLNRSEQGLSLEEVLNKIGQGRSLKPQFTRDFRMKYTQQGQMEQIQGRALKH